MKFFCIKGVEINPEITLADGNAIYFNEGYFQGAGIIKKVEATKIDFFCDTWKNHSVINVYFNPDNNKYFLKSDKISSPHQKYGYHLGGVTIKTSSCIGKILLPDNGNVTYEKFFNYEFSDAYEKEFMKYLPGTTFSTGFDEGYQLFVPSADTSTASPEISSKDCIKYETTPTTITV